VNPLNDSGKTIQKYFDEYIMNNKRLVTSKEKNFFYLYKLQDQIRIQKFKEKKDLQMLLNLSNYNSGNNDFENNKLNTNYSNIFLKKYFNNIKKPCLSDNESNLEENNLEKVNNDININYEKDEDFIKLNEYEQNAIRQLIKDSEENKKYKSFIEKALSDKKYFNVIDNDNVELDKKIELKTLSPIKHSSKKLLKLKIKNDNKDKNINNNSDESLNSSEIDDFSNQSKEKEFKITHNKKFSTILFNDKISQFKKFNFPQKKNNFISINKKVISEKDTNIKPNINNKKLSFSKSQEEIDDSLNKKIKRDSKTKKTQFLPGNKFLKKYNFPKNNINVNKFISKLSKMKSLNFLFKQINTGKTPDKKTLMEYKNYFLKNKNMSEHDRKEFIKRDYEPKHFYNLVNSVDTKIQSADLGNKWRKNYLKIGK
jgi:hypothetical protein